MRHHLRLLITASLAAPTIAHAVNSVVLTGNVNVEYTAIKIDQSTASGGGGSNLNNRYQTSIGDPTIFSRYGLLIREELGGDLAAIAKIEYGFVPGAGTVNVAREQWVGLTSNRWGTVEFGSVSAPFRFFAGGGSVDRFIGTSLHLRGSGGAQYAPFSGFGTTAAVDHAVTYISPMWSGFSFAALLAPSNATQADATLANTNQRNANTGGKGNGVDYQIAFKYAIPRYGDVFTGYSHDNANDNQRVGIINGKTADDETVWRLGANLKFGNFGLYGQYDHIKNALDTFNPANLATDSGNGAASCAGSAVGGSLADPGSSTQQCNSGLNVNGDGNIWSLGTSYTIGKTMLVVQGGKTHADSVGTALERTATNITVGAIYNLSKRTRVHVGYQNVEIEGARTVSQIGTLSGQGGAALAIQPDRSTFSMGMRHTF